MNHLTVVTIVYLLLPTAVCYQHQYRELNLISRLNNFYGFDHNIFLVDSLSNLNQYISIEMINTARTVFTFDQHFESKGSLSRWKETINRNIFVIIVAQESKLMENDTQLLYWVKAIGIKGRKVGVFFRSSVLIDTVQNLFLWTWRAGIVNIFCGFYASNNKDSSSTFSAFRFDPFGTFGLIDLTNEETVQNYFSDNLRLWRVHAKELYQDSVIINLSVAPVCDFNESMPVIYLSKTEKVYTRQIGRLSEDFFFI